MNQPLIIFQREEERSVRCTCIFLTCFSPIFPPALVPTECVCVLVPVCIIIERDHLDTVVKGRQLYFEVVVQFRVYLRS